MEVANLYAAILVWSYFIKCSSATSESCVCHGASHSLRRSHALSANQKLGEGMLIRNQDGILSNSALPLLLRKCSLCTGDLLSC